MICGLCGAPLTGKFAICDVSPQHARAVCLPCRDKMEATEAQLRTLRRIRVGQVVVAAVMVVLGVLWWVV